MGFDFCREREIVIVVDEFGGLLMWSFSVCRMSDYDMCCYFIWMVIIVGCYCWLGIYNVGYYVNNLCCYKCFKVCLFCFFLLLDFYCCDYVWVIFGGMFSFVDIVCCFFDVNVCFWVIFFFWVGIFLLMFVLCIYWVFMS